MTTLSDYKKLDNYIIIYHRQTHQRSAYPNGHGQRVSDLCIQFGKYLGYDKAFVKQLKYAARIHDFGKIIIPLEILEKTTALNPGEWLRMKAHPQYAFEVLEDLQLSDNTIPLMVLHHHLNYDGTGYPQTNIKEQDIPLGARIIAIIDRFDAMTHRRVYRAREREALTPECAIKQLVREAEKLDPVLLAKFIEMVKVKE